MKSADNLIFASLLEVDHLMKVADRVIERHKGLSPAEILRFLQPWYYHETAEVFDEYDHDKEEELKGDF